MIELSISQIKILIKSTEYYLKSKQQLNNTSNDEINDIKMLVWQLEDELESELKNERIYGHRVSPWRTLEPTVMRRKRPYFKKHKK